MNIHRFRTPRSGAFACAALLFLSTVATAATAQPPEGRRGERGNHEARALKHQARLFEILDLSEDQQEAWNEIHEAHRAVTEPLRERMQANREATREALESSNDATAIGELQLQGRALREEMKSAHEALQTDLTALLDDEQRIKFETLREGRGGRRGKHGRRGGPRGRRGGPGGPGQG